MTEDTKYLSGRDIVVVGGAGYIGSHVCKAVSQFGGRPITFDNLSTGHKHAVKWGPLEEVDIRNSEKLDNAFSRYPNVKIVILLASSIEVGIGEKKPAEFYDNNIVGALSLLNAMRHASATHFDVLWRTSILRATCPPQPFREIGVDLGYEYPGQDLGSLEEALVL